MRADGIFGEQQALHVGVGDGLALLIAATLEVGGHGQASRGGGSSDQALGGKLNVESTVGEGSRFYFSIPLVEGEEKAAEADGEEDTTSLAPRKRFSPVFPPRPLMPPSKDSRLRSCSRATSASLKICSTRARCF